MKHKILMVALGAIMATSCAVGLAACSDEPETHTHVGVHHDAVAPTCGVDGTIEYWSCEGCNELFSDAGCTKVITSVVDPATGNHTYGEAYGRDENGHWQICTVCGEAASATEHSYSTEYESDGTGHWHVCTVCEAASDVVEHTWKDDNTCSVCGYDAGSVAGMTFGYVDETKTAYSMIQFDDSQNTAADVVIPSYYKGLPVTMIGTLEGGNGAAGMSGFGADNSTNPRTSITIPATVTTIGKGAFASVRDVEIIFAAGSQLKVLDENAFKSAQCTTINLPEGVEEIGVNAFGSCLFESFTIPASVKKIGTQAFSGCKSLKTIVIPDTVTDLGADIFANCTALESVTLPKGITELKSEKATYGFFLKCTSLTTVVIPEGVTTLGDNCFNGCTSLTSVTIPNGVKSIGKSCFRGCSELKTINLPSSIETISERAFQQSGITEITIPENVKSIDKYTFYNCSALESIVIPTSITSIGDKALSIENLKIYYYGTDEQYGTIAITEDAIAESAIVYYYSGNEPSSDGNYWYMKDGVPTVWDKNSETV